MTAQPHNMRARGLKTYFVSVDRHNARKLQDATTILKQQAEIQQLRNVIKEILS